MSASSRPILGLVPGLLLCSALAAVSWYAADAAGVAIGRLQRVSTSGGSPISPITVAILLGLIVGNFMRPAATLRPGLHFAMRTLLRAGIVLVGLKLALMDIVRVGSVAVPIIAVLIAVAIIVTRWLAKVAGVGERFGLLAAAATSICGVTATVAAAPVLEAEEREVAYAVAIVTLFGMIGMLFYPLLAHAVFPNDSLSAGTFLGTSIHDTSQVIGAALAYQQMYGDTQAFEVATVTKLTRNLFIVIVIPLLGFMARRSAKASGSTRDLVPHFVLAFLGMAIIRSLGDFTLESYGRALLLFDGDEWAYVVTLLGSTISYAVLAIAMAAVGLSTDIRSLRSLGLRPLYVGASAAALVSGLGMFLASLV